MPTRISKLLIPLLLAYQVNQSTAENVDSKAIAKFSAKFCNELTKDKSFVSSPLSAEYLLALLALGSTNKVHSELLEALGFPNDDSIRSFFTAMSAQVKAIKGVTLNVANKVYVMEGDHELNPKLKEDAEKVFNAGIEKLDFRNGTFCADLINKWVEGKMNNRIKGLLSSDSLDSMAKLVLVNDLYFKGSWKKQFKPHNTRPRTFNINANKQVEVPMMYLKDDFHYGESVELQAQILKMEYVGGEADMVIVLPDKVDGLDGVLAKLAAGHDLLLDIEGLGQQKVQFSMPKFQIETINDLAVVLPKLGIIDIFSDSAGLSILISSNPLFVSKAVPKAFIEVDEEGTEAATATAMGFMLSSAMVDFNPVPRFTADRPFLILIYVDGALYFEATQRGAF